MLKQYVSQVCKKEFSEIVYKIPLFLFSIFAEYNDLALAVEYSLFLDIFHLFKLFDILVLCAIKSVLLVFDLLIFHFLEFVW